MERALSRTSPISPEPVQPALNTARARISEVLSSDRVREIASTMLGKRRYASRLTVFGGFRVARWHLQAVRGLRNDCHGHCARWHRHVATEIRCVRIRRQTGVRHRLMRLVVNRLGMDWIPPPATPESKCNVNGLFARHQVGSTPGCRRGEAPAQKIDYFLATPGCGSIFAMVSSSVSMSNGFGSAQIPYLLSRS